MRRRKSQRFDGGLCLRGEVAFDHFRKGKLVHHQDFTNMGTTTFLNLLFDNTLRATSQTSSWYIGLFSNTAFTAVALTDTSGSHAGWVESTVYSQATRVAWTLVASSGGVVTNAAAVAVFSINGSDTIKGCFISSLSTKGGTTGTLLATAIAASPPSVANTDTLNVTYRMTMTSSS